MRSSRSQCAATQNLSCGGIEQCNLLLKQLSSIGFPMGAKCYSKTSFRLSREHKSKLHLGRSVPFWAKRHGSVLKGASTHVVPQMLCDVHWVSSATWMSRVYMTSGKVQPIVPCRRPTSVTLSVKGAICAVRSRCEDTVQTSNRRTRRNTPSSGQSSSLWSTL